ncbi:hypothetical protein BH18THE2_BH18THE2_10480 [soil metagenome]
MTISQPRTEHSVYLKEIAEDFCESVKNEHVLIDAIDRILTDYYKVPKHIAKEKLRPMILQDNRIVKKVVAIEGKKKSDCLKAKQWIYHIEADENVMLDRILEVYEEYRSDS